MVRAKNYEIMSTFVQVMQKKRWPPFFPDTVYIHSGLRSKPQSFCHCSVSWLTFKTISLVHSAINLQWSFSTDPSTVQSESYWLKHNVYSLHYKILLSAFGCVAATWRIQDEYNTSIFISSVAMRMSHGGV